MSAESAACRGTHTWNWCLKMAHPPPSSHKHGIFLTFKNCNRIRKINYIQWNRIWIEIQDGRSDLFLGCDWPKRRQRKLGNKEQSTGLKDPLFFFLFWRVLLLFFFFFLPFPAHFPSQFWFLFSLFLNPEARGLPHHYSGLPRQIGFLDSWFLLATPGPLELLILIHHSAPALLRFLWSIPRRFIFYIHNLTQHWLSLTSPACLSPTPASSLLVLPLGMRLGLGTSYICPSRPCGLSSEATSHHGDQYRLDQGHWFWWPGKTKTRYQAYAAYQVWSSRHRARWFIGSRFLWCSNVRSLNYPQPFSL